MENPFTTIMKNAMEQQTAIFKNNVFPKTFNPLDFEMHFQWTDFFGSFKIWFQQKDKK